MSVLANLHREWNEDTALELLFEKFFVPISQAAVAQITGF